MSEKPNEFLIGVLSEFEIIDIVSEKSKELL